MKGKCIGYSEAELAWIEANKLLLRREAHAKFVQVFGRNDVDFTNYNALCKRNGWLTGRTGCFEKGMAPVNKGRPQHEWMSESSMAKGAETQFKKGGLPHNTNYLGHERISKDGYIEISVAETNPHTGFERRYVQKHRWLWEKLHGPVPKSMVLKCLDGNRRNTDPANWEAISRALLPALAGGRHRRLPYDTAPDELKPALLLLAKVKNAKRKSVSA